MVFMVQKILSVLLFLVLGAVGYGLAASEDFGREAAFAWIAGGAFGFVLQRSRFCFFCNLRDFVERRIPGGALALLLALAVGLVGYQVVTGAWIVDPTAGHLPPKAHISPVGWNLIAGGFLFGLGMAVSGSCISAHLYRLGEGAVVCGFALLGLIPGFVLGFLAWNPLYLAVVSGRKAVWLPAYGGFFGSLLVQLLLLGTAAALVWRYSRSAEPQPPAHRRTLREIGRAVFVERWPAWVGGLAVGLISVAMILRLEPLGVTSEFFRLSRTLGDAAGILPERFEGLDVIRGCSLRQADGFFSRGVLFILALVLASLASALAAGQFTPSWPRPVEIIAALGGGVLLGLGAMWSFGCTVGTLLSGIHASALSGWVFLPALLAGLLAGLPIRRKIAP
jgi:uncharacterized membrane protein YedE/YeeE